MQTQELFDLLPPDGSWIPLPRLAARASGFYGLPEEIMRYQIRHTMKKSQKAKLLIQIHEGPWNNQCGLTLNFRRNIPGFPGVPS